MAKKYYLTREGIIRALLDVSKEINRKTSKLIEMIEVEDLDTGETTLEPKSPNNFATNQAVVDYVQKAARKKLTINQKSAVEDVDAGYVVEDNITEYNGNDTAQITMNLVDFNDIKSLFIN